ncbi:hypothetical protein HQQ81_07280 [Microbacteriaceae bacterium VKM Ac-2854]|nr:hypothetical protein [Microbacteriaceae bacterium VKM Ac-2854]
MTTITRTPTRSGVSGFVGALAPLLGAGAFWVMLPAVTEATFYGVYVAIALAGVTALLAGASAAAVQDAAAPVADWLGLGGRVAAVAAAALIAGTYAWSALARPLAVVLIVVVAIVQLRRVRLPTAVRLAAVIVVAAALIATVVVANLVPPLAEDEIYFNLMSRSLGSVQVVIAASLILFAFLGQPARSGFRDRGIAAIIVAAILAGLVPLLLHFGPAITSSDVYLRSLVPGTPAEPLLRVAAVAAGVTSLAALATGIRELLSRRSEAGDLIGPFATISPRTGAPAVAQLALALASVVAVMILNIDVLATFAVGALLLAAVLQHWRALRTVALPRWIPLLGLILSVLLFAALPWPAITSTATLLAIVLIVRALRAA